MNNNNEQLEALYGPLTKYSDYKVGETITYTVGSTTKQGTIIWVPSPGQVVVQGGRMHGVEYIVESSAGGFPDVVAPGQIIATKE